MACAAWQRRLLAVGLLLALAFGAQAQDSNRSDWLRNPAMGNYKAYAEFKMAHYDAAREVWQTLAEVGNGDALFNLGILAEDGLGEPRNMARAESFYTSAAAADNFKAQYRLGLLYFAGTLLPRNTEKARLYLTRAATHGDRDAQDMLSRLGQPDAPLTTFQQAELLSGSGQLTQALALYRTLADAGDATAQTRLAWAYEAGRGVAADLPEAARRFEIAAQAGNAEAQYALAVMLRTGRGRAEDRAASAAWLDKAARQGHPAAQAAQVSEGRVTQ
ncbi:tetratricopeptide repeat protein [Rhodoferax lacus]|nr:tetratricopeptide repeat protein [Rhodoferax lacus]